MDIADWKTALQTTMSIVEYYSERNGERPQLRPTENQLQSNYTEPADPGAPGGQKVTAIFRRTVFVTTCAVMSKLVSS